MRWVAMAAGVLVLLSGCSSSDAKGRDKYPEAYLLRDGEIPSALELRAPPGQDENPWQVPQEQWENFPNFMRDEFPPDRMWVEVFRVRADAEAFIALYALHYGTAGTPRAIVNTIAAGADSGEMCGAAQTEDGGATFFQDLVAFDDRVVVFLKGSEGTLALLFDVEEALRTAAHGLSDTCH